ncbi:MAG: LexA family transcriptional regulator [Bacteroidota bacterium]
MSLIGKNIRKIRVVKKMSQNEFAKLFNVARPSIGSYEEGRAEPKIDTVIHIAKHFGISIDTLLTKEITINELLKFNILNKDEIRQSRRINKDEILHATPYVSLDKHSNYIVHLENKDFINELPILRLPDIQSNKSRAFQISGSAMEYRTGGIRNKDVLVCEYLDIKKYDFEVNQIYLVVHNQGITSKRFKEGKDGQLFFTSDNPSYESLQITKDDLLEVWIPVFLITNKLNQPEELEHRLSDIESKIQDLLDKSAKK